jgi:hypothetical protein
MRVSQNAFEKRREARPLLCEQTKTDRRAKKKEASADFRAQQSRGSLFLPKNLYGFARMLSEYVNSFHTGRFGFCCGARSTTKY